MHSKFASLVTAINPDARLIRHWTLTGGVSAQTTALEIECGGARERLVVRQHGARDTARDPDIALHEFQLLDALYKAGLPAPAPIYVARAGEILDRPAVVMQFVDGDVSTASSPMPPDRTFEQMAYWLARIHQFDLSSADLGFLVANDYQSAERFDPAGDDSPLVTWICDTLRRHGPVPFANRPALLHGDFWRGNLLWKDNKIASILDWEDAMIGDPIIDLARSRLELHWTLGQLARERFTSHYLSYQNINIDTLAYWDLAMALGFARDLPGWGLPPEREQQMTAALERFVVEAMERLSLRQC